MNRIKIFLIIFACSFTYCLADENPAVRIIEDVKLARLPLDMTGNSSGDQRVHEYLKYYGMYFEDVSHYFGTFDCKDKVLAANVFVPPHSRGTVIVVHGYYDHAGVMRHVIAELLNKGYTVAIYDQPGHGLSGGERASIDDFSEYTEVFQVFLDLCAQKLKGPFHVVAHSMGCAIITDYLLSPQYTAEQSPLIERIVFMAPLIRSKAWNLSGFGMKMLGSKVETVPRKFRKNCSDKEFIKFVSEDPLQPRIVPLNWAAALRSWNGKVETYNVSKREITLIQGKDDTTVDWKYNVGFLEKKFAKVHIVYLNKAGHQLMNEIPALREQALQAMMKCFE